MFSVHVIVHPSRDKTSLVLCIMMYGSIIACARSEQQRLHPLGRCVLTGVAVTHMTAVDSQAFQQRLGSDTLVKDAGAYVLTVLL